MRLSRILSPALALGFGLLALGCSPEKKAAKAFEDYDVAFAECKKISDEAGAEPGTHYCSKIASMALEMSLEDTGLDAAAQKQAITDWAKTSAVGEYYVDEAARESIPDL